MKPVFSHFHERLQLFRGEYRRKFTEEPALRLCKLRMLPADPVCEGADFILVGRSPERFFGKLLPELHEIPSFSDRLVEEFPSQLPEAVPLLLVQIEPFIHANTHLSAVMPHPGFTGH